MQTHPYTCEANKLLNICLYPSFSGEGIERKKCWKYPFHQSDSKYLQILIIWRKSNFTLIKDDVR